MGDADEASKKLSKAARELKDMTAAEDRFAALADAIIGLASTVTAKAKAGGLKAKDVLDLAKAVALAQKIRAEVELGRRSRREERRGRREGWD